VKATIDKFRKALCAFATTEELKEKKAINIE
jgi:hypothetical protein